MAASSSHLKCMEMPLMRNSASIIAAYIAVYIAVYIAAVIYVTLQDWGGDVGTHKQCTS